MKHSVSVTCCALLVSSISLSYAAEVPSGTVLAEKQELVRHIKDEPASLDPAKAVGLPEIQVIRDLFEGLVNQNEKGEIGRLSPALRLSGKVMTTVSGLLPCAITQNGRMAHR